jgi:MipA family protein
MGSTLNARLTHTITAMNHPLFAAILTLFIHTACLAETLKPEWELGLVGAGLSQQAYPGSSYYQKAAFAAPVLIYRGKFLRSDENGAGLRAINEPNFELDIGFAGSLGSNSSKIPVRQGMPNIGSLVEFGPRAKWYLSGKNSDEKLWLELPVRGVFNVSERAKYQGYTMEPQLTYELNQQPWRIWASTGAVFGDTQFNQAIYSVDAQYSTASRPAYQGKAGLVGWKASVGVSYSFTNDFSLFGGLRASSIAGASNASSPVVDRQKGLNYGIGLLYFFAKSDTLVKP